MKKTSLSVFVAAFIALLMAASARAQSAYSNAVMSLNPAGYWPMHEVEPPTQGDIETNYGTIGLLGTGYYPDWAASPGVALLRQHPGPFTNTLFGNNTDVSVNFTHNQITDTGNVPYYTNGLWVAHTFALTTLNPPFSVECWFCPTNVSTGVDVWSQCGAEGLNAGAQGNSIGTNINGIELRWVNSTFVLYAMANGANQGVANSNRVVGQSGEINFTTNAWYHLVVTCNAQTNFALYTNGNQVASTVAWVGKYQPDYWTPMAVGDGDGGTRSIAGYISEFAVYTNALNFVDVNAHYHDGLTEGASQYFSDVMASNPAIYFRMNGPTYSAPGADTWPVLQNLGMTNGVVVGSGVYSPGTMPGLLAGPTNYSGMPYLGVTNNSALLSGVSSFGDAGSAPAYNPTGSNANFTVTAIFRGYPCDDRIQSIVGHGTNSWELTMTTNGCLVFNAGNGNTPAGGTGQAAGDIRTTGVYNDGRWHQVVAVNSTNVVSIYVDGVLDTNGTPAGIAVTNLIPGNSSDVMIGSDPIYTNNPPGVGRSFAGQICDVAFFTSALSASQVQALFSAGGVAPTITTEPVSAAVGQGSAFTNVMVVDGSAPLIYQWFTNGVAFGGQTNADLILNPVVSSDAITNYYAIVTNNYGSATSTVVSITVYGPPTITGAFPVTYTNLFTLYAGANPSFSVAASGAQPISYYWFTNGVADGAVTGSTNLLMSNVQTSFTNYCVVSNFVGSVTSLWAAAVIPDPVGAGSSGLAPYPQTVLTLKPIGYWRLNDINLDGADDNGGDNGYVCNDYAGGNDGIFTNVALGQSSYDPTADPSDSATEFGETSTSDFGDSLAYGIAGVNFGAPAGTNVAFTVEAWVSGFFGQAYDAGIVNVGWGGAEQFDLDTGSDGGTPNHAFRFFFRDASGNMYSVNSPIATEGVGAWDHLVGVVDEITNHAVSFYVNGVLAGTTPIPSGVGVLAATTPMGIGSRMGAQNSNFNDQFYGDINDVSVFNYALSPNQVAAQYASVGAAPAFSPAPPARETLLNNEPVTIPAAAIGTPPLGYLWQMNGTTLASGTTNGPLLNATFSNVSVPASWNGTTLELTVTNAYGITNVSVLFSVNTNPPEFTLNVQPQVTVVTGDSYLYSIEAVGVPPLSYQWYNAGTAIAAQTNTTYTVAAGTPGNTSYSIVVSNMFGVVTSTVSTFTSISATPPPMTGSLGTNVLLLKPAGYWPMHEAEGAAPGDVEPNCGTLGLLGTGYYPDWAHTPAVSILRQRAGPFTNSEIANNTNMSVNFTYYNSNEGESFTNGLFIPHSSPFATLNPPFTVECWYYSLSIAAGAPVWSATGQEGLNAGDEGAGGGEVTGMYMAFAQGGFVAYTLDDTLNGTFGNTQKVGGGPGGTQTLGVGVWTHLVLTCDGSLNMTYWTNGVMCQTTHAEAGDYAPDYWTPITIACGNGCTKALAGYYSEFAIYTNVLQPQDIAAHYNDGINAGSAQYASDVMVSNPVIYLRMNSPAYSAPATNFWPALFNYGTAGGNGLYSPGTFPGIVPGPTTTNGTPFSGLSGTNVAALSGVSSFADAGYAAAYNPTGSNAAFSVMATFRGNPCDGRPQSIVGHGTNSWQLTLDANGSIVFNAGNGNHAAGGTGQAVGDITTVGVYNDGNWHQVVAVNSGSTISIYVDGVLDTNGTPTGITSASTIPGNTDDVMIGSDPVYTNDPPGVGASFAGQICDVAFFTNALNAGEVQALYSATLNPSNVPAFVAPEPPLTVTVAPGGTLALTAGAAGTAPLGYQWQMITNGGGTDVLQTGSGNNANLNVPNVPASWNGGQLELTVTNAYGTNMAFVALSVINSVNTSPTNIIFAVTNNQLSLSWPADHTGWQLQAQTNNLSVGISTNWVNVSGTPGTNQVIIPINLTNGSVFYRLVYP